MYFTAGTGWKVGCDQDMKDLSYMPLLTPSINISGCNNVKIGGPTSILKHNPQKFHGWKWTKNWVWSRHEWCVMVSQGPINIYNYAMQASMHKHASQMGEKKRSKVSIHRGWIVCPCGTPFKMAWTLYSVHPYTWTPSNFPFPSHLPLLRDRLPLLGLEMATHNSHKLQVWQMLLKILWCIKALFYITVSLVLWDLCNWLLWSTLSPHKFVPRWMYVDEMWKLEN